MKKAVFLDRDGVINEDEGLITDFSKFHFIKGSLEAIRLFNKLGFVVIVVTNQPVIARGLCSEDDIREIHSRMQQLVEKEGARIDEVYYCPHHPETNHPKAMNEYRIDCDCRKPKTGMLLEGAKKFNIDMKNSFMIGDRTSDILAGKNSGCTTILVETGLAGMDKKHDINPDFRCKHLKEASLLVEKMQIQALIMAGGKGTRLYPLTIDTPKSLLEINGKPLIEHQIELMRENGIDDIIVCGGHLFEKISQYLKEREGITLIKEEKPLGTGGAIKNAERYIKGMFLVIFGDIITDINVRELIKFHMKMGGLATVVVRKTDHPEDSDIIEVENSKAVRFFSKTEKNKEGGLANTGIYLFNHEILDNIARNSCIDKDVLAILIKKGLVYAYKSDEYFQDIGTPERYENAKRHAKNRCINSS